MSADVQAWLDEATMEELQPPCDYAHMHGGEPPAAKFVIRWTGGGCECHLKLACMGCTERKIAQTLTTPDGRFSCSRCGAPDLHIASIEPL